MSEAPQERRMNRTLTQKYDLYAMRALQNLESKFLESMAAIYKCEEDDIPIEVDLLKIYNDGPETRREQFVEALKGAPGDVTNIIDELIREMEQIEIDSAADAQSKALNKKN